MKIGLRSRVLLSFTILSLTVIVAFFYGAWTFRNLEARMEVVNDLYVPALKALNQIESSFFLLESDLDKSFQEGIVRPKDTLESVLISRIDLLSRLNSEQGDKDFILKEGVSQLGDSYKTLSQMLTTLYRDWGNRTGYEPQVSSLRTEFRLKLKGLIRDLDRELRLVSVNVQAELKRLALFLTLIIGFCCTTAFIVSLWLARSMRPIETLANAMRKISQQGLNESIVKQLSELPEAKDEIGTLSRESFRMASSLLDSSKILHDQKQNLERAHTELGRQNDELRRAQAKLIHSEKLTVVGKMAAQMAHEIRNPLNALNLHVELLEEQTKGERTIRDGIAPLRKEINRLISVTDSYLDLARAPKIQAADVQVNEVVEELHDLYEPVLKEKGIFFTCDLADLPKISVDKGQLSQVLGNLIKNASEAFEGGHSPKKRFIRVITQYHTSKKEITISVMDNGIGIPTDQQKNVFSPFFTSKAQGTGLGLTFSRQVIEAHGGDISFESAQMKGTKFTIRLPVIEVSLNGDLEWKVSEQRSSL